MGDFITYTTQPAECRGNIAAYLIGCQNLGVKHTDNFDVLDLYEYANLNAVLRNLEYLNEAAKNIPEFKGPYIGDPLPLTNAGKKKKQSRLAYVRSKMPSARLPNFLRRKEGGSKGLRINMEVEVYGLQSAAGKPLNGKTGT